MAPEGERRSLYQHLYRPVGTPTWRKNPQIPCKARINAGAFRRSTRPTWGLSRHGFTIPVNPSLPLDGFAPLGSFARDRVLSPKRPKSGASHMLRFRRNAPARLMAGKKSTDSLLADLERGFNSVIVYTYNAITDLVGVMFIEIPRTSGVG